MIRGPLSLLGVGTLVAAALVAAPSGRRADAADPRTFQLRLTPFAAGLSSPVALAMPHDGTGRFLVAEQTGRVRVVTRAGVVQATPYLDLTDRTSTGGERGVLGVAPHPAYSSTGWVFVAYTDLQGDLRVSRFTAAPRANVVNRNTELVVLDIPHRTYTNHNGGQLAFGGDGKLYVSTGDGGSGGDPQGNAQNLGSLLGKILRIDVSRSSSTARYAIPGDNPFARSTTARREIWHFGLRNPWRFSFDPPDQRMWIADVGQGDREELSVAARTQAGRNFGWDCREGTLDVSTRYGGAYCSRGGFIGPFLQYDHGGGRCAIIGGHVYRGRAYPAMFATYVYADFCSGDVWTVGRTSTGAWVNIRQLVHTGSLTSFGVDDRWEMFATDLGGQIYRLSATPR